MDIRNRITGHRRVKASNLKAHPHNPRNHPDEQRSVLRQLLQEVGFARSVLAYIADADRPLGDDAPLTLINGRLRQKELGDTEVDVEILDINDEEASTLLLAIDPLATLADYDAATLATLQEATRSDAVRNLWQHVESASARTKRTLERQRLKQDPESHPESYQILICCKDEREQVDMSRRSALVVKLFQIDATATGSVQVTRTDRGRRMTFLGLDVVITDKLPTLNTAGDILLLDCSRNVIGDRQQLSINFSPHARFVNNQGVWRFVERVDGRPWMDTVMTLPDGSNTVSPFIALAAGA